MGGSKCNGTEKGKDDRPLVLRVVVGLAFLAAGGSKLAGAPALVAMFAKIGSGNVPYPNRLAGGGRGIGLFVPRFAVYGRRVGCCDGRRIGFHLTNWWKPCPLLFCFFCDLDRLVEQEDFTVEVQCI